MKKSKKIYSSIDVAKFAFCLCIVCLHAQDYYTFQSDTVWFIRQFVFRMAVPFFFVTSGYFLGIKLKKSIMIQDNIRYVIKGYCIRLIKPLFVFEGLNVALNFVLFMRGAGWDLKKYEIYLYSLIKQFMFYPMGALWYVQASIVAVLLFYFFYDKVKLKKMMCVWGGGGTPLRWYAITTILLLRALA